MYKTGLAVVAGVWMMMYPLHVHGIEVADTVLDKAYIMEEVEVQARPLSRHITSAVPVQRMEADQLADIAAHNVADAMKHFAGTQIRDYGGIGGLKTVSVRGLGATHTAVSYDGVVMGNCQAGQIDLGRFASNGLEEVSLSVGQDDNMAATARALASGSIVNLSSRKNKWNEWNGRRWKVEETYRMGSFGYFESSTDIRIRSKECTWTRLNVAASTAHGRYPYVLVNGKKRTVEKRANTDVTQWLGEWDLHHSFDDNGQLDAKLYAYTSERGLPGAVILYNDNSSERLYDRNIFAQAKYSKPWGDRWHLNASVKYTYGYDRYTDRDVKYEGGEQTDVNRQDEFYAQMTMLYRPTLNWQLSIAHDMFVNKLVSNIPSNPNPMRGTSLTALQAQYRTERVNLRGILLGTLSEEYSSRAPLTERSVRRVSPTMIASLRPFDEEYFYLRLMYKETFRMPTFNDLYYFRSGNRHLRPEQAHEYNIGLTWQSHPWGGMKNFTVTLDGYFNEVTDKIVAFPTTYVWKMANYGHVHIAGLDGTCATTIEMGRRSSMNAAISYTLTRAMDVTDPQGQNYGIQLPYTPVHSGSCRLTLATPWINVGYSALFSSERYSMSEQLPRYRIDGYAEHTLTLARTISVGQTQLKLQAEAINFTNVQYQVIQYYPMPGRQFRLTMTLKL